MRRIAIMPVLAVLLACGSEGWEDVSSLEVSGQTVTAGDAVRLVPSEFRPAEISDLVTTFSFDGTLLDQSRDLVLIPTVSILRGSGGDGNVLMVSERRQSVDDSIHWSRNDVTRGVDIDYVNLGDTGGEGRFYFYLTDEDGTM